MLADRLQELGILRYRKKETKNGITKIRILYHTVLMKDWRDKVGYRIFFYLQAAGQYDL